MGRVTRGVVAWSGTVTALSSIHHGGETKGTLTLLRREVILQPDGSSVLVPVISGNTFRGRLRRVGEELLREALGYEGIISAGAAHALRGGGALVKTSREPLSGSRLARVRHLVPHVGVFGAAGGGTIIDGALVVLKVIPYVRETNHITGSAAPVTVLELPQVESYTRQDDTGTRAFTALLPVPGGDVGEQQMLYRLETFPAGTVFSAGLQLRGPSQLELAFFVEVLRQFAHRGHLGGRIGIGHGRIQLELTCDHPLDDLPDWRAAMAADRDEAIAAIADLA